MVKGPSLERPDYSTDSKQTQLFLERYLSRSIIYVDVYKAIVLSLISSDNIKLLLGLSFV